MELDSNQRIMIPEIMNLMAPESTHDVEDNNKVGKNASSLYFVALSTYIHVVFI